MERDLFIVTDPFHPLWDNFERHYPDHSMVAESKAICVNYEGGSLFVIKQQRRQSLNEGLIAEIMSGDSNRAQDTETIVAYHSNQISEGFTKDRAVFVPFHHESYDPVYEQCLMPLSLRELSFENAWHRLNGILRGRNVDGEGSRMQGSSESREKMRDRELVHSLKSMKAAGRILVGAFKAGDISGAKVQSALERMGRQAENVRVYLEQSTPSPSLLRAASVKPVSTMLKEKKVRILLVDDDYDSVGWNIVFDEIFGQENMLYARSRDEALALLAGPDSIGVVLLDLKLPVDPEQGISLLRDIKTRRLDLPVIIFTAEDTIRYQRKCFAEGCFAYFVKEFSEEDKNYLSYFKTLRDMIVDAVSLSQKSEIWQSIVELEKLIPSLGPRKFAEPMHFLRKAYFFLTVDPDSWLSRMLLSRNEITHYGEVVIQCALSVEWLVNNILRDHRNDPSLKVLLSQGRDIEDINHGTKLGQLKRMNILTADQRRFCDDLNNRRVDCVHPYKKGLEIKEKEAEESLAKTVILVTMLMRYLSATK